MTDTIRVVSIRIFKGTSPFKADNSHFHYRLRKIGLSPLGVSTTFFLISTVLSGTCVILLNLNFNNLFILFVLLSTLLTTFNLISFIRLMRHKNIIKKHKNSINYLIKSNHLVSCRNISSTSNS